MKTILVIRSSAMGDVAMSAPVLKAINQKYGKEVSIVMLTPKFYAPFFRGIDQFEIFNIELRGRHKGFWGIRRLYKELKNQYKFDAVIDLNGKIFSHLLCKFFRLNRVPTYQIDKGRKEKKAITRYKDKELSQLKTSIQRYSDVFKEAGFDISVPNQLPQLHKEKLPEFAELIVKNKESQTTDKVQLIGISPFAQHQGKILPLQTIREVIEQLKEEKPNVLIFIFGGGKFEKMVADSLVEWYDNVFSVIGECCLEEEMNLMSNLEVMLSMDSSAMHLCSLLGVKVVSIWGATHPYAGFLGLGQSEEDIVQINELECRPCSVYGNKPCKWKDYRCLQMINAKDITAKIKAHL